MGGATKISVYFNGIKSVNINLIARLSVVYLTICILHCDKDFYKYTRKLEFNVEPAISFFLKNVVYISSLLHTFKCTSD